MEVRVHQDPREFWALAGPLFTADPIRHTVALTVVQRLVDAPDPTDAPPILLTLWEGDRIVAAAPRTPPWPLISSGLPDGTADAAASTLREIDPGLPGVSGPRPAAETFGKAWTKLTGASVRETMALRLYRLAELDPLVPAFVPAPVVSGHMRLATVDDVPTMVGWRRDFEIESFGREKEPGRHESIIRRAMAMGNGQVLWEVGGQPVCWAAATAPVEGMSRVGPVYTPPEFRGRGYGSAATAAVSQWALDTGAQDVLLFTDLANPTSNSIYQRVGYRPVYDSAELEFERPNH